ncbi:MAG: hypothetical protein V4487_04525 [Chlamydiota bacterium]
MKIQILSCLFTLALFAEEHPPITKLQNGIFAGLGGNYNSVKIDQQLSGTEFSSVFSGSSLVALGESGGLANSYHTTHSTLAPQVQLGYLHRFSNSSWLLGCKAVYQYLGVTFTENNLDSFQAGMYTAVSGGGDTWIGHFLIGSSQTHVDHELFFLPIFGYFFNDSSAYLGAGPVVFRTQHNLYGIRGFARINGVTSDIAGAPANLSFSQWMWGGVAQLGWIYPFTSSWFLDLTYSYAVTANATLQDSVLFSNSLITGTVYTEEGIAFVKANQRVTAQSFTVTISKSF